MNEDPQWPRASTWLSSGDAAARLGVVGVPIARTSISPSRADTTPPAIRLALQRFSTYNADLDVDLREVPVSDHGDLDVAALAGEEALRAIDVGVRALPSADLLVLLGGDNALTRPAMRALVELPRAGLLTLDAHHDVRDFHAGPTNGTPVRGLIGDGLDGRNVVQVGIGGWTNSAAYRAWCDDHGISVVTAAQARAEGVGQCVARQLEALAQRSDVIYVDLDVDVVDRTFVPGCPGARPGGLQPHELLDAAVAAGRHAAVRAIDIVEVDAQADPTGVTVELAALCLLSAAAGYSRR